MLKKIRLLFMGLIVLAGSACVTPTHASSASSVVLTFIQAAGQFGAKDELISLYNNSPLEVDITDWCLRNKALVLFACFTASDAPGTKTRYILPGYSSATIASFEYLGSRAYAPETVSLMYYVTSETSGSLVGSSDVVTLVNADREAVDILSWSSAASANKYWSRTKLFIEPDIYATGGGTANWKLEVFGGLPEAMVEVRIVDAPILEPEPEPQPETPVASPIIITEILANAAGSDTGKEYIELHNPSPGTQPLDNYKIRVGTDAPKWYEFPTGASLEPGEYKVLSDTDLGFALPNTSGAVQLYRGDEPIGDAVEYTSPKDDAAWALVDGMWVYTAATPGAKNEVGLIGHQDSAPEETETQKPCASNQFRNPETGRCKLIASATTVPVPCKSGQERNPETGRCRNIATATEPTPCKEGQERNPETNRCRNIVKMSSVGHGVKGVQEKASAQLAWYYWAAIAGIVILILAYASWEWREELLGGWRKVRGAFAKK